MNNDGYDHSLDAQFAALRDQDGMLIGAVDGVHITPDMPVGVEQWPHGRIWQFCPCHDKRPEECALHLGDTTPWSEQEWADVLALLAGNPRKDAIFSVVRAAATYGFGPMNVTLSLLRLSEGMLCRGGPGFSSGHSSCLSSCGLSSTIT